MEKANLAITFLAAAKGMRGRVAKLAAALSAIDALSLEEKAGIVADVHRSQMEEAEKTAGVVLQVTAWLGGQDLETHVLQYEAKPGHVLALAEALEIVMRQVDPELALALARESERLAKEEQEGG